MTAAVILAAGASTRFGSPKQMAFFEGERLLERTVRIAGEAGCSPIVVVLGANAEAIQQVCSLAGAVVLINELWPEGMASSLRLGISAVRAVEAAIVLTCDMPNVTPSHLRTLTAASVVTASRYADRNGVPAFFPKSCFAELLTLQGDAGARGILRGAASQDLIGGELDIDIPEDLGATYLEL